TDLANRGQRRQPGHTGGSRGPPSQSCCYWRVGGGFCRGGLSVREVEDETHSCQTARAGKFKISSRNREPLAEGRPGASQETEIARRFRRPGRHGVRLSKRSGCRTDAPFLDRDGKTLRQNFGDSHGEASIVIGRQV